MARSVILRALSYFTEQQDIPREFGPLAPAQESAVSPDPWFLRGRVWVLVAAGAWVPLGLLGGQSQDARVCTAHTNTHRHTHVWLRVAVTVRTHRYGRNRYRYENGTGAGVGADADKDIAVILTASSY